MLCSPSHLFIDFTVWYMAYDYLEAAVLRFYNLSDGDQFDCGLITAPCAGNMTRLMVRFDTSVFFWFDNLVVYGFLSLVILAGTVGNVINIVIFSTTNIASDSTNSLLLALSVSDLFNLITNGVLIVSCVLCLVDNAIALTTYNIVFPQMSAISRWLSLLSLDLVAVISTQRAAAVVFPFKVSSIFSQRSTNILIALLVVLAGSTVIMVLLAFNPRWFFHPYFGREISLGYSEKIPYKFVTDYITYYLTIRSVLDLVVIFVTGSLTVINLRSQAKSRATMKSAPINTEVPSTKTSAREANAIKMSLTVCFVTFVIYVLVILGNGIIQHLFERLFTSPLPIMSMYSLFLLNSIGSAFNFFLYLGMSPKYKEIIKNCFKTGATGK